MVTTSPLILTIRTFVAPNSGICVSERNPFEDLDITEDEELFGNAPKVDLFEVGRGGDDDDVLLIPDIWRDKPGGDNGLFIS